MKQFWTLYAYEWKKIVGKRLSLLVLLACLVVTPSGLLLTTQTNEGTYHGKEVTAMEYAHEIRKEAMQYNDLPMDEEFFSYVRSDLENGRHIFGSIWYVMRNADENMDYVTAAQYYRMIDRLIEEKFTEIGLTDAEKDYWYEKKETVERPTVFGYSGILRGQGGLIYSVTVFEIVLLAACMAYLFAEEHQRRTDAMILSSVNGRGALYLAKMAAGVSFALATGIVFAAELIGVYSLMYGFDGTKYAIQISEPTSLYNMTALSFFIMLAGVYLLTVILMAILIMVLSELTKNGVAVTIITVAATFLFLLINFPRRWRIANTILYLMPGRNTMDSMLSNYYLISVGGLHLNYYQYMPVLYLLLCVLLFFLGKRCYEKYEV